MKNINKWLSGLLAVLVLISAVPVYAMDLENPYAGVEVIDRTNQETVNETQNIATITSFTKNDFYRNPLGVISGLLGDTTDYGMVTKTLTSKVNFESTFAVNNFINDWPNPYTLLNINTTQRANLIAKELNTTSVVLDEKEKPTTLLLGPDIWSEIEVGELGVYSYHGVPLVFPNTPITVQEQENAEEIIENLLSNIKQTSDFISTIDSNDAKNVIENAGYDLLYLEYYENKLYATPPEAIKNELEGAYRTIKDMGNMVDPIMIVNVYLNGGDVHDFFEFDSLGVDPTNIGYDLYNDETVSKIIWNFIGEGDIYIGRAIWGTILAPDANVILTATIDGAIYANKIEIVGGELHQSTVKKTAPPEPEITATGNLEIKKTVLGCDCGMTLLVAPEYDIEFLFQIELDTPNINGFYGDVEFTNGIGRFTLKHEETKHITNLPAGISYIIKEIDNKGYTSASYDESGIIMEDRTIYVDFVNTRDPKSLTGDIKITKEVTGNAGETDKEFEFIILSTCWDLTGQYGDVFFRGGGGGFTLKDNDTITITGLPAGSSVYIYEVDEGNNFNGYTVSVKNSKGNIIDDSSVIESIELNTTKEIKFINHKEIQFVTINPHAQKILLNKELEDKEFSFSMEIIAPEDSYEYNGDYTVQNDIDGNIVFGEIKFFKAGIYTVKITEDIPETQTGEIIYDDHEIVFTYTVVENESGDLEIKEDIEGDLEFVNYYTQVLDAELFEFPLTGSNSLMVILGFISPLTLTGIYLQRKKRRKS